MAHRRNHFLSTAVLAASALAVAPAAAVHAAPPVASGISKTSAILGAQSRLAAILAEQGAPRPLVLVQHSSFGPTRPFTMPQKILPRISPGSAMAKPDIFGTVALKVRRTPLDGKWRRVAWSRIGGRAAKFAESLRGSGELSRLDAINRYVNSRVQFVEDARQYRHADVWAAANDTLNRGRGDCEDYAIAKLQMLIAAGFSDRDLYLVILKDLVRRSDHAVAVVRSGDKMLVLDNSTDRLLESEAVTDYRPILTFAASGAWTHGYRVRSTPNEVAAISRSAMPLLVPAAK
jgi:predicted transglutaminase-like cysteine proteinase